MKYLPTAEQNIKFESLKIFINTQISQLENSRYYKESKDSENIKQLTNALKSLSDSIDLTNDFSQKLNNYYTYCQKNKVEPFENIGEGIPKNILESTELISNTKQPKGYILGLLGRDYAELQEKFDDAAARIHSLTEDMLRNAEQRNDEKLLNDMKSFSSRLTSYENDIDGIFNNAEKKVPENMIDSFNKSLYFTNTIRNRYEISSFLAISSTNEAQNAKDYYFGMTPEELQKTEKEWYDKINAEYPRFGTDYERLKQSSTHKDIMNHIDLFLDSDLAVLRDKINTSKETIAESQKNIREAEEKLKNQELHPTMNKYDKLNIENRREKLNYNEKVSEYRDEITNSFGENYRKSVTGYNFNLPFKYKEIRGRKTSEFEPNPKQYILGEEPFDLYPADSEAYAKQALALDNALVTLRANKEMAEQYIEKADSLMMPSYDDEFNKEYNEYQNNLSMYNGRLDNRNKLTNFLNENKEFNPITLKADDLTEVQNNKIILKADIDKYNEQIKAIKKSEATLKNCVNSYVKSYNSFNKKNPISAEKLLADPEGANNLNNEILSTLKKDKHKNTMNNLLTALNNSVKEHNKQIEELGKTVPDLTAAIEAAKNADNEKEKIRKEHNEKVTQKYTETIGYNANIQANKQIAQKYVTAAGQHMKFLEASYKYAKLQKDNIQINKDEKKYIENYTASLKKDIEKQKQDINKSQSYINDYNLDLSKLEKYRKDIDEFKKVYDSRERKIAQLEYEENLKKQGLELKEEEENNQKKKNMSYLEEEEEYNKKQVQKAIEEKNQQIKDEHTSKLNRRNDKYRDTIATIENLQADFANVKKAYFWDTTEFENMRDSILKIDTSKLYLKDGVTPDRKAIDEHLKDIKEKCQTYMQLKGNDTRSTSRGQSRYNYAKSSYDTINSLTVEIDTIDKEISNYEKENSNILIPKQSEAGKEILEEVSKTDKKAGKTEQIDLSKHDELSKKGNEKK